MHNSLIDAVGCLRDVQYSEFSCCQWSEVETDRNSVSVTVTAVTKNNCFGRSLNSEDLVVASVYMCGEFLSQKYVDSIGDATQSCSVKCSPSLSESPTVTVRIQLPVAAASTFTVLHRSTDPRNSLDKEWMNEWIYLVENPQDKKGHKTTYTCPHTVEHI